jgi:histidinol phosphatase-like PHP family hydrolase
MKTIEKIVFTEHEASDLVLPRDYKSENEYRHAKQYASDFKVIRGEARIDGNLIGMEYKIMKQYEDYADARKYAIEQLLASLAEKIL